MNKIPNMSLPPIPVNHVRDNEAAHNYQHGENAENSNYLLEYNVMCPD